MRHPLVDKNFVVNLLLSICFVKAACCRLQVSRKETNKFKSSYFVTYLSTSASNSSDSWSESQLNKHAGSVNNNNGYVLSAEFQVSLLSLTRTFLRMSDFYGNIVVYHMNRAV